MPEFGDEFIIESFKFSWLIWIQLIVTVLLIILLFFGFSIFTSDPTSSSTSAARPAPPSTGTVTADAAQPSPPRKPHRRAKMGDQRRVLTLTDEEPSEDSIAQENQSEEESSSKDSGFVRIFQISNNPCNYFGLAKQALLKCFGLDSTSEPPRRHRHEEQE